MAAVKLHSMLVTGANRGIGFEFIRQFLTNQSVAPRFVIAACRVPDRAFDLLELQKKHSNLHILKLDVTNFGSFDFFVREVGAIVADEGLTLLINNAGINIHMSKLEEVEADKFISILNTNTVGPVMLTQALLPLLRKSATVNAASHNDRLALTRAAVINISSGLGSIQAMGSDKDFQRIRTYAYGMSKAALNMATQLMSLELEEEGILAEAIRPGLVKTDMAAHLGAKMSPETSVAGMIQVMLSMDKKNKNGIPSFDGKVVPF